MIVECDFLLEGKKIKIGNVVLLGTKKTPDAEIPLVPTAHAG